MEKNYDKGFDEDQKIEIQAGISDGLDVSYYTRQELLAIQMRQIRLGLMDGIDVTVYNRPEYDWFQMEEIRLGMKAGVNHQLYANPEINYRKMRQTRLGLESGIDLSPFLRLDAGILEELRKAILAKISIVDYIKEGYDVRQLAEIRAALEKKQDIRKYINNQFIAPSIREISLGLEEGLSVEYYADIKLSWQQMRELRLGMEKRLNTDIYRNRLFSWQQMREIRLGLEEGLDVSSYCRFYYMPSKMEKLRKKLLTDEAIYTATSVLDTIEDKNIHVFVSSDKMEASIELTCEDDVLISENDIYRRLKARGITYGILKKEIKNIVNQKKYREKIVVARGQEAIKGTDGKYDFFFDTNPSRTPQMLPDGSVDFRNINWCEIVQENQKVAYYHAAKPGKNGYTVTGQVVKARHGKEEKVLSGKGFRLLEDGVTYVAAMDGKIELMNKYRLEISRVCIFKNVNLTTGDIYFDGTVYVTGNVERGSEIYATEDIIVDGYVEAANITAEGNICLRQGTNGDNSGKIDAKGNVTGKFFEAISVVAGGDINVHYCLNCDIQTEGRLTVYGRKGLLAGGIARAAKGVKAYNIGNKAGLTTTINVGIDNKSAKDIQDIESKVLNVKKELEILTNSYADYQRRYAPEIRNLMDVYLKIENAIFTKKTEMKELLAEKEEFDSQIREMKEAKVVIEGTLYEGVLVIIDNVYWNSVSIKHATLSCKQGQVFAESN